MAIEEDECVQKTLKTTDPIPIKPIELENIGYLQKKPTLVSCPACEREALTLVHLEVVTCWQRFLRFTDWCKTWESRRDINHYCSKCGCYIGRYVPVNWRERCISLRARRAAPRGTMNLKTKPIDCAERMQRARVTGKAKQAEKKAEKEAKSAEGAEQAPTSVSAK